MTGLFVAVEGPGGVGKSTIVEEARRRLVDDMVSVHATTQPSHTRLGDFARHGTEVFHGMALACLIAADRYHQLGSEIEPALNLGAVVLCDRYVASSLVLQHLDGVPREVVWELNRHARCPDLTVILQAPPELLDIRLEQRGAHSRFENTPGQSAKEVREFSAAGTFLREAGYRVEELNCTTGSPDQLAAAMLGLIAPLIKEKTPHAC